MLYQPLTAIVDGRTDVPPIEALRETFAVQQRNLDRDYYDDKLALVNLAYRQEMDLQQRLAFIAEDAKHRARKHGTS